MKLSKEKWLSIVQSAREKGENEIGGPSTVTPITLRHKSGICLKPLRTEVQSNLASEKPTTWKDVGLYVSIIHPSSTIRRMVL